MLLAMEDSEWTDIEPACLREPPARPLVKVALGYMAGLVVGWTYPISVILTSALLLVCFGVMLLFALRRSPGVQRSVWICAVVASVLIGTIRAELISARQSRIDDQVSYLAAFDSVSLSGRASAPPVFRDGKARILLDRVAVTRYEKTHSMPGSVELWYSTENEPRVDLGQQVQAECRISLLQGAALPSGFSPRDFYYARAQVACAYADSTTVVFAPPIPTRTLSDRLMGFVWGFGNKSYWLIRETFPSEEAGLLLALGLGINSQMSWEVKEAFRKSGLAHITVVSGLHLTLLLSALLWFLRFAGFRRRIAASLAIPFLCFFLLLIGPRIPVVRATILAAFLMGGIFLERPVDRLNALAAAALAVLLIWPEELLLPSFQLSFMAVLALIVILPGCMRFLPIPRSLPWSYIVQLVLASFAVTIALAPIAIYHCYAWSTAASVGNLIVIPLLSFLLPLLYVFLILHHIGLAIVAGILVPVVRSFAEWMISTAMYLSNWGYLELTHSSMGLLAVAALVFLSISLVEESRKPHKGRPISLIVVCLALATVGVWYDTLNTFWRPLRVDFLSLGQGDSTFIRTPQGSTILVDGGAPHERYKNLVEYLLDQGIRRIDLVVLTHPEADHIGALPQVISLFPVGLVIDPGKDAETDSWQVFCDAVMQSGVAWKVARAGDEIGGLRDIRLRIVNPSGPRARCHVEGEANEDSLVLLLSWRNLQIALTGDIGFETEENLNLRADGKTVVLKVPHHGSRYSSSWEFIENLHPVVAVAEVGRNPYGHPHERTMRRYWGIGAQFFRTDRCGTVCLQSDGDTLRILTTRRDAAYEYAPEQSEIQSSGDEQIPL